MLIILAVICIGPASASGKVADIDEQLVELKLQLIDVFRSPKNLKLTRDPVSFEDAHVVDHIVWTTNEAETQEPIYCVGADSSEQLRFVCIDCEVLNITDIIDILNATHDITEETGFPTIILKDMQASVMSTVWTGLRIICQAEFNNGTNNGTVLENSDAAVVEVLLSNFETPRVFTAEPSGYK